MTNLSSLTLSQDGNRNPWALPSPGHCLCSIFTTATRLPVAKLCLCPGTGYGETQPLVSLVFSQCIALLSRGLATGGVGPVPVPKDSFAPSCPPPPVSLSILLTPPHLCPTENPREALVLQVSLWLWRSLLSASVFPLGWSCSSALETWRSSGECARLGRGISPSYRGSPEILPPRELCRLSTY